MNLLFTSSGRRNYLIRFFREARCNSVKIIAVDMQKTAPSLAEADKGYVVPEIYSKNYIDVLLSICKTEKIDALLPLNDLELPILAKEKEKFEEMGVRLIISDLEVIETCFDKIKSISFSIKNKINYPKTYLDLDEALEALGKGFINFPLVVKPRWGSASIGLAFPETAAELELAFRMLTIKVPRSILFEASKTNIGQAVLIQEKINGTEYGLDILNDFKGEPQQVYIKEKLAMRAGETDKAVLRNKPDLELLGYTIGKALGHIGNLDCDVFEQDGVYYLLEMNPRFGGGYPFSHMSGADYPSAICAWIQNKKFDFTKFVKSYDQPFAKCDNLVRTLI
jgi:carbamoyl-phosphate synthase large subunit